MSMIQSSLPSGSGKVAYISPSPLPRGYRVVMNVLTTIGGLAMVLVDTTDVVVAHHNPPPHYLTIFILSK
ncbi:hypothetical protein Tco_1512260, partial [Tanacetum coccineum]